MRQETLPAGGVLRLRRVAVAVLAELLLTPEGHSLRRSGPKPAGRLLYTAALLSRPDAAPPLGSSGASAPGPAPCRDCVLAYFESDMNAGRFQSRCPAPDCGERVADARLNSVSSALLPRLLKRRSAASVNALLSAFEPDMQLGEWAMDGNAQACPGCFQLIEKDHGCMHMQCGCGQHFCYRCGLDYGSCN